jgi:hypothetical protein
MDIKRFIYTNVDGNGDTRSRLVVELIDHHVVYASETYTNDKAKSWERAYFVPGTKEFLYKDLSPECLNQFSKCYDNSIPLKEKIYSQYDDCIDNYEVIGNYENPTYEAYADRRDKYLSEVLSQEMDVFFSHIIYWRLREGGIKNHLHPTRPCGQGRGDARNCVRWLYGGLGY